MDVLKERTNGEKEKREEQMLKRREGKKGKVG